MLGLSSLRRATPPPAAQHSSRPGSPVRRSIPLWLALPALLAYTFVVMYPAVTSVFYSVTDWSGLGSGASFVGLSNYAETFTTAESQQALVNTLLLALVVTCTATVSGLGLALALQRRTRLNYILRLSWFLPAALPTIAAGYIWSFIYSPDGPLDQIWRALLPTIPAPGFLATPTTALWCIMVIVLWQSWGYSLVICASGLESIDREVLEAALVDGASPPQRFRYITLPLLRTALGVSATITLVNAMLVFGQIIGTTGGGPGYATETLAIEIYRQAFIYAHFGFGMALGIVVGIVVLATSGLLVLWTFGGRD